MSNRVYIFDTTLRDGEQSPGVSLNALEKLEIAKQLARLGVDIIEAGFPISSQGDFEAVKNIACQVRGVTIAGLARTNFNDIDRAWEAVRYAEQARIHTFIATSDIHLKHKLRMTREQVLEAAASAVKRAKGYTADVEFSTEDGFRSDLLYLCQVVETAIAAGATTINIPDTVGYATPGEYAEFIGQVISRVKGAEKAVFSVHCHDDLGMAVANSLAAVLAGARQVEGAINGIGERAGNASIEEIAMALHTRKDLFGLTTGIDTREIYRTSRLVSRLSGMEIQPNKAVVGRNAFAHESGIHQDGVLKERTTYEIMNPAMVGLASNNLVLGKLSGRHAFKERLIELGYQLSDEELNIAFTRFKELADRKKEINNQDIEAIVENEIRKVPAVYELSYLHINSGTTLIPTATVILTMAGKDTDPAKKENASCGNGPVDAICKAVDSITGYSCKLIEWGINAIGSGQDALGEVTLRINENGSEDQYMGRGISTDILEASAKAYVDAINKMIYGKNKR